MNDMDHKLLEILEKLKKEVQNSVYRRIYYHNTQRGLPKPNLTWRELENLIKDL